MSIKTENRPVEEFLNESTSFPYTPSYQVSGVSIINEHATDPVTVVFTDCGKEKTVRCTTDSRAWTGDFKGLTKINVTAGTTYQIEVRGL